VLRLALEPYSLNPTTTAPVSTRPDMHHVQLLGGCGHHTACWLGLTHCHRDTTGGWWRCCCCLASGHIGQYSIGLPCGTHGGDACCRCCCCCGVASAASAAPGLAGEPAPGASWGAPPGSSAPPAAAAVVAAAACCGWWLVGNPAPLPDTGGGPLPGGTSCAVLLVPAAAACCVVGPDGTAEAAGTHTIGTFLPCMAPLPRKQPCDLPRAALLVMRLAAPMLGPRGGLPCALLAAALPTASAVVACQQVSRQSTGCS
jgi:hypothetical protein